MIAKLVYSAVVASTALVAAKVAPPSYAWIAPVVCGCLAALIVRGIVLTTPGGKAKRIWSFEALVTALSVLLTGVIVEERELTIMYATISGIGIGGLGVGVITITKTYVGIVLKNIALGILSNGAVLSSDPDKSEPDKPDGTV